MGNIPDSEKVLKNKVAIITGASRGIGKAIAQRFAEAGASVVICARNDGLLKKVSAEITSKGQQCLALRADVTSENDVAETVKKTLDTHGHLDILVNNAGMVRDNLIARMKPEDWDIVLSTNLKSAFLFISAAAKPMIRKRSGRIINITSVIGIRGNAGQANYAASKAGIIGLTKSAAREFASRNILVNAIAPGFIVTDMTDQISSEQRELITKEIPLNRLGQPEDIANAALFLASERASYITGQVINVDGGMII
ncbi:MAG: 3-oxoacyl-[acyl-carrier-protein] reductase [Candidatus Omnitrophica bacterium]|nr:3-oxoacyl-[acyl-carrier-protein] reductase [Candidatus Omnitrophota bacterium]